MGSVHSQMHHLAMKTLSPMALLVLHVTQIKRPHCKGTSPSLSSEIYVPLLGIKSVVQHLHVL